MTREELELAAAALIAKWRGFYREDHGQHFRDVCDVLAALFAEQRKQAVEELPHVVRDREGDIWVQRDDGRYGQSGGRGRLLKPIAEDYGPLVTICGKHREPDQQPQPTAADPSPLAEVCRAAAKYLCTGNPFDRAALVEVLERIGAS